MLGQLDRKIKYFALCKVNGDQILLSGGMLSREPSAETFIYETQSNSWITSTQPKLNHARALHSSCATDRFAFVYAGYYLEGEKCKYAEVLPLGQQEAEWSTFELPSFHPAKNTLMAAVNQESVMVLGGKVADDDESFGVLFDSQTRQVTCNVKAPADAYKFVKNAHGVTPDGQVVALAEHE